MRKYIAPMRKTTIKKMKASCAQGPTVERVRMTAKALLSFLFCLYQETGPPYLP